MNFLSPAKPAGKQISVSQNGSNVPHSTQPPLAESLALNFQPRGTWSCAVQGEMRDDVKGTRGLTLLELLVVIALLGILAALLFPALSSATARGRRAICLANVKQLNQGVLLYAADNHDILFPYLKKPDAVRRVFYFQEWTAYVALVGRYVGWNGDPSPQNRVFACPADTFHDGVDFARRSYWLNESLHSRSNANYSSYFFNAANAVIQGPVRDKFPTLFPGVLGSGLSSISTPGRTILLGEEPAWSPYSWHAPSRPRLLQFNHAQDMLGFADGHVGFVKMYYDDLNYPSGVPRSVFAFDPPAAYDYQWSGN
jgi:prepilin-type N-terminal cleavage/methylation domain-containing protein